MRKIITLVMAVTTLNIAAAATDLLTGDYHVEVRDRSGNVHHCTLEVENKTSQDILVLNINDCPPVVTDIELYPFDNGTVYTSAKIPVNDRHGGYKMYEIHPKTSSEFEMYSFRVFADGREMKPRSVYAIKK